MAVKEVLPGVTVSGRVSEPTISLKCDGGVLFIRVDDEKNPAFWLQVSIDQPVLEQLARLVTGKAKFQTTDGYTLYQEDSLWVDSQHPEGVDLVFQSGPDGLPVDDLGKSLQGKFLTEE